jgi:hypothetical protein
MLTLQSQGFLRFLYDKNSILYPVLNVMTSKGEAFFGNSEKCFALTHGLLAR